MNTRKTEMNTNGKLKKERSPEHAVLCVSLPRIMKNGSSCQNQKKSLERRRAALAFESFGRHEQLIHRDDTRRFRIKPCAPGVVDAERTARAYHAIRRNCYRIRPQALRRSPSENKKRGHGVFSAAGDTQASSVLRGDRAADRRRPPPCRSPRAGQNRPRRRTVFQNPRRTPNRIKP